MVESPRLPDYSAFRGAHFARLNAESVLIHQVIGCVGCRDLCRTNDLIVKEEDDQALLLSKVDRVQLYAVPAKSAYRIFPSGPSLCGTCAKHWREGKLAVALGVDR